MLARIQTVTPNIIVSPAGRVKLFANPEAKPMNENMAKFLSTVSVWTATALIFILGVFRFHAEDLGVFLWAMLALGLVWAAIESTKAIWGQRDSKKEDRKADTAPASLAGKV